MAVSMCNDAGKTFIKYCYSIQLVEVVVIFERVCIFALTKNWISFTQLSVLLKFIVWLNRSNAPKITIFGTRLEHEQNLGFFRQAENPESVVRGWRT
jgi:hypothetical protein